MTNQGLSKIADEYGYFFSEGDLDYIREDFGDLAPLAIRWACETSRKLNVHPSWPLEKLRFELIKRRGARVINHVLSGPVEVSTGDLVIMNSDGTVSKMERP